jgi:integrase
MPVDDAVVDATVPHLPPVVADMVRLQRLTGMRPAEVCGMRPADIDRTGEVWEYRPRSHKTAHHGHKRVIFIGPQAQTVLLRYLARDPEAHCFRPVDSEAKRLAVRNANRKTPMCCGNTIGTNRKRRPKKSAGDQYSTLSYGRAVARACLKAFPVPEEIAGDPQAAVTWNKEHHWFPNQLRHSAATEIRKKFGLEAAQTVLGHSKANMTERYAERDQGLAANVARQIG